MIINIINITLSEQKYLILIVAIIFSTEINENPDNPIVIETIIQKSVNKTQRLFFDYESGILLCIL